MKTIHCAALKDISSGRHLLWSKDWTPDLRTLFHFHRSRDDPPRCLNASGHPVAVEVVVTSFTHRQKSCVLACIYFATTERR